MAWQYIYLIVIFMAAAISFGIAVYAWQQRNKPGGLLFAGMMLAVAEWLFTSGMVSMSQSQAQARYWVDPRYFGLTTMLAFFITFVLQYTGHGKWLTKSRFAFIFAIPIVTQIIIETNPLHHWFLVDVSFSHNSILMGLDSVRYGPIFWLHTVYSYMLVLIGIGLIVQTSIHTFQLYREQSVIMILGVLPPLLTSVIDAFLLIPGLKHPLAPLGFAFMGMAFAWAMFQHRMLDIVPVARDIVIDSMSDGMMVLDSLANVVDINPSAQQLLELESYQVIGKPAAQVFHPWNELVEQYQGQMFAKSEIILNVSGQDRYFDLRISPLKGRRGQSNGCIIILRDITLRKQAEEALRLANVRLQETNKQLADSNVELKAFAHTVAHDLKSPLTMLLGYSLVLEEEYAELPSETIGDIVHTIVKAGNRLAHIIDALLLLASVREIKEITTTPLDMSVIVAQVLDNLAQMIEEYQAEVIVPDVWPQVIGYGPWIEIVWTNYITNALKYGGHPPHVELGALVSTGEMARFWVQDNGRGLSVEEQMQLFTPFTRLEQTRTKGYGLGLSIVKRIVEKLGGQVRVESEGLSGKGSTFLFTLPLKEYEHRKAKSRG